MKNWTSSGRDRWDSRAGLGGPWAGNAGPPHTVAGFLVEARGRATLLVLLAGGCPDPSCGPSVHPGHETLSGLLRRIDWNGTWTAPPRFKPPRVFFQEPWVPCFPKSKKIKRQTQTKKTLTNLTLFLFFSLVCHGLQGQRQEHQPNCRH